MEQYRQRMLRWFIGVGLVAIEGKDYVLISNPVPQGLVAAKMGRYLRRGGALFLGEAPPHKALKAPNVILECPRSRQEVEETCGRNSLYVLMNLGLIDSLGRPTADLKASLGDAEEPLRMAASQSPTVKFVLDLITVSHQLASLEVGKALASHLSSEWSEASMVRYGGALQRWARWLDGRPSSRGRARRGDASRQDQLALDIAE